jgi:hypothetical protein
MNYAWIPIGTLLGLSWVAIDHLHLDRSLTVYQLQCSQGLQDGHCMSAETTRNPVTFRVYSDLQRVIYWSDHEVPQRLHHCAVRNLSNWSCEFRNPADDTAKHSWQMVDGRFYDLSAASADAGHSQIQVSRWRWWWVRMTEWL